MIKRFRKRLVQNMYLEMKYALFELFFRTDYVNSAFVKFCVCYRKKNEIEFIIFIKFRPKVRRRKLLQVHLNIFLIISYKEFKLKSNFY